MSSAGQHANLVFYVNGIKVNIPRYMHYIVLSVIDILVLIL